MMRGRGNHCYAIEERLVTKRVELFAFHSHKERRAWVAINPSRRVVVTRVEADQWVGQRAVNNACHEPHPHAR